MNRCGAGVSAVALAWVVTSCFGDSGIKYQIENKCGEAVLLEFVASSGFVDGHWDIPAGSSISVGSLDRKPSDEAVRISRGEKSAVEFQVDDPEIVLSGSKCPTN